MLGETVPSNVKIFCCCSMKKSTFYLMINLLDLIFIGALTFELDVSVQMDAYASKNISSKSYKGTGLLIWLLAALALILYCVKKNYTTMVHKVYSVVRIIVSFIRVVIYSLGCLIIFIAALAMSNDFVGAIVLAAATLILFSALLFFEIVNLCWSFELKKIVFEDHEIGCESNAKANHADVRVPLESGHSASAATKPEAAKDGKEHNGAKDDKNTKKDDKADPTKRKADTLKHDAKGDHKA